MASRDVAGNLRVGIFEKIELPDGRIAKPLKGTSTKIDYDVEGKTVRSTSRYSPFAIQYDADAEMREEFFALPLRSPNRSRSKR